MYAITSTSYRAIASADDVQPGETAVNVLPARLLTALAVAEARSKRDVMLMACDWTQGADSPLDTTMKAAWVAYRQALRDVPEQTDFPEKTAWPTPPS